MDQLLKLIQAVLCVRRTDTKNFPPYKIFVILNFRNAIPQPACD